MKAARIRGALLSLVGLVLTGIFGPSAWAGGTVNVYSERQPVFLEKVFARFTEKTGIKVETLFAKKGLIERIKLEGGSSVADVIMVADVGRLSRLKQEGITQGVDDAALLDNIPPTYRDADNHWFGVTRRARILFARKGSRQAKHAPPTYEELGAPSLDGTVCMRTGNHPYNIALIAAHIAHHGDEKTEAWLSGLEKNLGRKPQGNDRAQITAVANGECDYALANNYYYFKMVNSPDQAPIAEQVAPIFPKFEGGGTHVNLSGYALAKHSPNRDNALALMRFLTDAEAQLVYAGENGEFPVRDGLGTGGAAGIQKGLHPDIVSASDIAELRSRASSLLAKVGFGE